MFGLDTQSLREGADALLSEEGDFGMQIFSASLGGKSVETAIAKLEEEANALYKGSAKVGKTILPALAQFKESEKAAKQSATVESAWKNLQKELKAAEAEFDRVNTILSDNRSRTEKLNNLTKALPSYSKYQQLIKQLSEIDAPDLSSDFIPRFRETFAQKKNLSRELQILQQSIADQQTELDQIPNSTDALQHLADVESLSNGFETYLANIETVDYLQREIETHEATLQLYSEQLELASPDKIAELSTISESHHSQFKQLVQALSKQNHLSQLAHAELAEIDSNIVQYQDDLQSFSNSSDTSELEDLIQLCESHAGQISNQEERETEAHSLSRLLETLRARLNLEITDSAILALSLPSAESIQLEQQRENELREKCDAHQQKIESHEEELATEQAQLDRLKAQAAIYSQTNLTHARQDRDAQLNQLSTTLAAGKNLEPAAFTQLSESITLADTIADALHSNAENIAKAEAHRSKIEALTLKKQNSERYKQEAQSELTTWSSTWQTRCAAIPVPSQSPTDLIQWRSQWLELCSAINKFDELQHKSQLHNATQQELVTQMQAFLQINEPKFRTLYSTLKSELKAATHGQGKREAAETALTSAKLKRKLAADKLENAETALADSHAAWLTLCDDAGLTNSIQPEQALDLIEKRNSAQQKHIELRTKRKELETKSQAIEHFHAQAQNLSQLLLPDAPEQAAKILPLLKQHIARAQQSQTKASTIQSNIATAKEKLPALELQLADIESTLFGFQQQAKVQNLDAMEPAILAIEAKIKFNEALDSQRDTLQSLAQQTDLDHFFTELDGLDHEQLQQELNSLRAEAEPLQQTRDLALKELNTLKQQLSDLQQASDAAASHKQDAANALATIVTDTERFIKLQYAITFLRDQIEAYRKQSQQPMMEKTSHYFRALTSGRYSGVAAQLDDKGKNHLVALRSTTDGTPSQEIHTPGLSEGTRDQLYLALRLAAIDLHLDKHTPIPLILDDLLMTFDDDRTRALLPVLAELSKKTQVIIFSHHAHLNTLATTSTPTVQLHLLSS